MLISTVQIEYCPLPALAANWWKRKRLNYPGDFVGERSSCSHITLKASLLTFHSFVWLLLCAFHLFLFWNCSKHFCTVNSLITSLLASGKATLKWSLRLHSFLPWQRLLHIMQHFINLHWALNKQMWLAGAIGHDAPAPWAGSIPTDLKLDNKLDFKKARVLFVIPTRARW